MVGFYKIKIKLVRFGVVILILAMPEAVSREAQDEFEKFFREHYRLVFAIFAKRGCTQEDCEDLSSETFLRAFRSVGDFLGESKESTWLHTIATNVWRNWMRDAAAAKRDGIEVSILDDGRADPVSRDQPYEKAIGDERLRLLKSAINDLPPQMRRCVRLRVYQDMNYRDIAAAAGVSVSTAKSQVSLARRRLRSLLTEQYPELDDDRDD